MRGQGREFMQVLAVAVGGLSNLSTLVPMVQQLGVRHAGYGVRASHYDSVRQALLYTLAVILQDEYTDEVRSRVGVRLCDARRHHEEPPGARPEGLAPSAGLRAHALSRASSRTSQSAS